MLIYVCKGNRGGSTNREKTLTVALQQIFSKANMQVLQFVKSLCMKATDYLGHTPRIYWFKASLKAV